MGGTRWSRGRGRSRWRRGRRCGGSRVLLLLGRSDDLRLGRTTLCRLGGRVEHLQQHQDVAVRGKWKARAAALAVIAQEVLEISAALRLPPSRDDLLDDVRKGVEPALVRAGRRKPFPVWRLHVELLVKLFRELAEFLASKVVVIELEQH